MQRINKTILSSAERLVLDWACRHMPSWISSDMLTALGVLGAGLSFVGFVLSASSLLWLWLSVAGLFLNWVGDSLDGSLARHRGAERKSYGFFLDHMTDTLAMALVTIGIGLTPYVLLEIALAALAAYFMMTILSMATCIATGVFRISFGGVGPTEIRLVIALCCVAAIKAPVPVFSLGSITLSLYDGIMAFVTLLLTLTGIISTIRTARMLAISDPPKHGI